MKIHKKKFLDRKDKGWLATLFGTAVGAGVLYLPVTAAEAGFVPLIIIAIIAGPVVWMSHRNLTRFCLSSAHPDSDITSTATEKFGKKAGGGLILAYFLSIFPILLLYGIGLTNVINQIIVNFFHVSAPPRYVTSFFALTILQLVIIKGEKWVLYTAEMLVIPLIIILLFCACYFIPVWHAPSLGNISFIYILKACVLTAPLIVFSFNHSPACSAFAQAYRLEYGHPSVYNKKVNRILGVNTTLLLLSILPFIFSCVLSMTPTDVKFAIAHNIPALTSISSAGYITWMPYVISGITLLAITSSFLGVYIGSHEGITGMITWAVRNTTSSSDFQCGRKIHITIHVLTFLICWVTATADFSVINIIQEIVSPVLAIILFIMPVVAMYYLKEMRHYRKPLADLFIFVFGIVIICSFIFLQLVKV